MIIIQTVSTLQSMSRLYWVIEMRFLFVQFGSYSPSMPFLSILPVTKPKKEIYSIHSSIKKMTFDWWEEKERGKNYLKSNFAKTSSKEKLKWKQRRKGETRKSRVATFSREERKETRGRSFLEGFSLLSTCPVLSRTLIEGSIKHETPLAFERQDSQSLRGWDLKSRTRGERGQIWER